MSTRTRFEKEAKGNSEMAYFLRFGLYAFLIAFSLPSGRSVPRRGKSFIPSHLHRRFIWCKCNLRQLEKSIGLFQKCHNTLCLSLQNFAQTLFKPLFVLNTDYDHWPEFAFSTSNQSLVRHTWLKSNQRRFDHLGWWSDWLYYWARL